MCKQLGIIVVLMSFLVTPAFAQELSINFDTYDYSSRVWVTAGASHTYLPTGGWRGGAAKFTPPTSEGYSGLRIGTVNARRVNIRFLYYIGSAYVTGGNNKWAILMRSPYADGSRLIVNEHQFLQNSLRPQVCHNTGYCVNSDFNYYDRTEEWICIEIESNLDANTAKIYLTTQDGVYNNTVIASNTNPSPSTGTWGDVQILGGYYQEMSAANVNKYVKYDELRVSTRGYIGPPQGFVGGNPSPLPGVSTVEPPAGLRIINQNAM